LENQILSDVSKNIKVLHIDDEETQLEMMEVFLSLSGYPISCTSTSDPSQALILLKTEVFDCIISDFSMPDMNGIDLARKIRDFSSIPIILYTGRGSEEVAETAFSVGVNDYIRKELQPSHYQVLAERIVKTVEKKRSENIYIDIVEDTIDAVLIQVGTKIVFANSAQARLFGASSPLEVIGKDILEWVVPEDKDTLLEALFETQMKKVITDQYNIQLIRKDGSHLAVTATFKTIDFQGEKATLLVLRDITEQIKVSEEKTVTDEKFKALINLAPDGVISFTSSGKITYANPSYFSLTGYSEDEILGKNFLQLQSMRNFDPVKAMSLFTDILRGKVTDPLEFQYMHKDGHTGWGEARVSKIRVSDRTELIAIIREISSHKELQEKLRNQNDNLEHLVKERTEELFESERMATIGKVTAMVAHDLRGPLNTIKNAVYVMDKHPEKSVEMIKLINASIDKSISLLEETRNKTKEVPVRKTDANLALTLRKSIDENVIPSNIQVNLELDQSIKIKIDELKIRRVFDNLIINAVQAMPLGGVLTLSAKNVEDNAVIKIRDTGEGIPDEISDKIFKTFFTTKEKGTGLGLSYCKRTVEEHGGELTFETKKGEGTVFIIKLPIKISLLNKIMGT
jgi:two-component system sporulation sensor kinase A